MRYVTRCLVCMVTMGVLAAISPQASAQEILPGDLLRVTGQFTGGQQQQAASYVAQWSKQLTADAGPVSVADARRKLVDPLIQPGGTDQFKNQYSALVVPRIAPGASSSDYLVRLNTMIVIGNLTGGAGVQQMITGLHDEDAAVRYWAAKAIAQSLSTQAGASVMSAQQRASIQQAINEMMPKEKSADVLEQMYDAMASINTPASLKALVDAMNSRVAQYVQQDDLRGLQAERTGLRRLYRVTLERQIQGDTQPQVVKDTAAVCQRYLQLISSAVAKDNVDNDQLATAQEIVEVAQTTLGWALKVFDPTATPGPKLIDPFRAGAKDKYVLFRLNVLEWSKLLKSGKIGLTDADLKN